MVYKGNHPQMAEQFIGPGKGRVAEEVRLVKYYNVPRLHVTNWVETPKKWCPSS